MPSHHSSVDECNVIEGIPSSYGVTNQNMLRIRLSRTGKIRQPSYRVVVAEKESKRDGRIVENIGHYNPLPNPVEFQIKEDRALYWLSVGAQPSDAVRILLEKQGTFGRLSRLHAGESLESLVTEYAGESHLDAERVVSTPAVKEKVVEAEPAMAATAAVAAGVDKVEDVVETVVEKAKDVAEASADVVEDVVESVVEKTEDVIDEVKDAVEAAIDTDEEE